MQKYAHLMVNYLLRSINARIWKWWSLLTVFQKLEGWKPPLIVGGSYGRAPSVTIKTLFRCMCISWFVLGLKSDHTVQSFGQRNANFNLGDNFDILISRKFCWSKASRGGFFEIYTWNGIQNSRIAADWATSNIEASPEASNMVWRL